MNYKEVRLFSLFLLTVFSFSKSFSQDTLLYPSLAPGKCAPIIKGKGETGKPFSLSKLKSRYTLLYFYEVHCHLCEVVTPQLKKLYGSYYKLGMEVVAVPVESNKEEWLGYIKEQSLNWKNVFLSRENLNQLRTDYKLTVSPTIYLLDKNKILLAQRMWRAEQVEEELNKRIR